MTDTWHRVTKAAPCAICGKPDWCTYAARAICCMRVESTKPAHNGGWMHAVGSAPRTPPPRNERHAVATIDAPGLMRGFAEAASAEMVSQLAASLGVDSAALEAIGVGWATGHNAWAFAMRDWRGNIIGIRLRDHTGHKWAVRGSRAGLFYAEGIAATIYVCEGPTDTAAGLSIGLQAVGRASCLGLEDEVDRLAKRKQARRIVIVSDNDGPGQRGAVKLADVLTVPSVIWTPPAKDLREFVQCGGTHHLIDSLTSSLVWTQPKVEMKGELANRGDSVLKKPLLCQANSCLTMLGVPNLFPKKPVNIERNA